MKNLRKIYGFFYFFILKIWLRRNKNVKINKNANFGKKTFFAGFNMIGAGSDIDYSSIGYATYIGKNTFLPNCQIGAYCSIAHNVQLLAFTHPSSEFVSTHPSFFSLQMQAGFTYVNEQLFKECLYYDFHNKVMAKIGNDVWIGANVIIMGGIEIGDGAIVAAGSVVTKNVMPYEIVGGVPAKTIKMRFNEEEVKFLKEIKWWEKDNNWILSNSKYFNSIQMFINKFNGNN